MREGSAVRFEGSALPARGRRDPWHGIHTARYRFALELARGDVLDVACGSGYGLPILRTRARTVVGVDLDPSAAATTGRGAVVADGLRLPFADASFDVVTSFETLEHLEERARFVAELRRVLRPEGLLILSTPNARVTGAVDGRPLNPHHVFEYTPEELASELEPHFDRVRLLGQVLSERIRISPFSDDHRRLPRTVRARGRVLLFRLLLKLPPSVHDPLSETIWGHALVAGENDYEFREDAVEQAPVVVALGRPRPGSVQ